MEDRESLQALVAQLPDVERQLYNDMASLSLESAFPGRKLVIYTLRNGAPTATQILTLGAMSMSVKDGPSIELTTEDGRTLNVGMVPTQVPGKDVFLHVPQKFELRWKGRNGRAGGVNFAAHYAVLIKTWSKPHLKVNGDTCCVRLNQFREMFPDVRIGY